SDLLRVSQGQLLSNHSSHRVPRHVGRGQSDRVQQPRGILGQLTNAKVPIGAGCLSRAPVVEDDHAMARSEYGYNQRPDGVIAGKSGDKQQGVAGAPALVIEVASVHLNFWHESVPMRSFSRVLQTIVV